PPRTSGLQSGCERIPWAPESAADGQASSGICRPAEARWSAGAICAAVSAGSLCKVGPRCRAVPTRREYISVGSRFSSDRRRSCADAIALPPAPADRGSAEAARQVTGAQAFTTRRRGFPLQYLLFPDATCHHGNHTDSEHHQRPAWPLRDHQGVSLTTITSVIV